MSRWTWQIALMVLLFSPCLHAQGNVAFNWIHSWGGSSTESGSAVATDSSGNVYVAGSTESFGAGDQDVLLLKYNTAGTPQWARTWGGSNNDFANGVITDANGFVYVVGGTESFGAGWFDVLLLKFDDTGNLIWERTWGGSSYDVGYDISFDNDGNLAIAAESYSFGNSAVLLTFSTEGTLLGEHAWKGPATYDSAYSITVDGSGNQILTGISWDYSVYPNHNTIFVLKYDSQGTLLWSRDWAGPSEDETNGRKTVRTDAQGNIYIAGRTAESCTNANFSLCDFDVLLLKIDPNGNLVWAKKWGGPGWDTANSLSLESNGNPVVVGSTRSFFGGVSSALIQEYNSSGGGPVVSKVLVTSAASDWFGLVVGTSGTYVTTGDGPNNGGKWQDTGISSVPASGSVSVPSYSVYTPSGIIGTPSGTVTDPLDLGATDTGGGGLDALTGGFSLSACSVKSARIDTSLSNGVISATFSGSPCNGYLTVQNNMTYWTNFTVSTITPGLVSYEPVGGDSNLYARFGLLPPSGVFPLPPGESVSYRVQFSQPDTSLTVFADPTVTTSFAAAEMNVLQSILNVLPLGGAPTLVVDNYEEIQQAFEQMPHLQAADTDLFQNPPDLTGATNELFSFFRDPGELAVFNGLMGQLGFNVEFETFKELVGTPWRIVNSLTTAFGNLRTAFFGYPAGSIALTSH